MPPWKRTKYILVQESIDVGDTSLTRDPVEPDDGDTLKEGNVHQGQGRHVIVHNVEHINATLEQCKCIIVQKSIDALDASLGAP